MTPIGMLSPGDAFITRWTDWRGDRKWNLGLLVTHLLGEVSVTLYIPEDDTWFNVRFNIHSAVEPIVSPHAPFEDSEVQRCSVSPT